MTLTLDFQGQILKMMYLRNGRTDWHGTKGMRVDRMLDPHCDFKLWPHPWPWPLIFKVKFKKMLYLRNGMPDWHGTKEMWVDRMLDPHCDFELWPHPRPWFSRSNFEKVITQEWDARLTWNERDVSRLAVGSTLSLSSLPSPMTLTLNFQLQILK